MRFIQLRRDNYVAIIRSGRSVDPALESVVDDMHRTLSLRVLDSIGVTEPGPTALMLTRSWLAGVEEAVDHTPACAPCRADDEHGWFLSARRHSVCER